MNSNSNEVEAITNALESAITGIPTPIRKNFFKAFGQLCTAAVDIPVAWLESQSAEIRALNEARIKLIKKEGEEFYNKTEVSAEYVAKASSKYASKIIKEQLNLDEITLNAANNLASDKVEDNQNVEVINEDWLNEFESHARLKSSEDMKTIFGKILSGEISNPGKFSIRTVKLISQLDNQAAKLFQKLCSQTISINWGNVQDARVVSFNGSAATNSLGQYGLSFNELNILQEYGLIITDYNSWRSYTYCIAHEGNTVATPFIYAYKKLGLIPTDKERYDKELKLNGVTLTKAGRELLSIIPVDEQPAYTVALMEFFKAKHLTMVGVQNV